jgi:site-specific DNA recombinase
MTEATADLPTEVARRSYRRDSSPPHFEVGGALRRAVVYLRVSTAQQAETDRDKEGFSIPAQRDACYRKAEALGAQVVEEYIDRGESARSADRPALQALLQRLVEQHDIDLVVVHKVDRLARSREDDVAINLAIRASGAQLVSVSENIDETPSGMLLHGIMSSIAEFYSANLAAEALKGMNQKAKKGGTPTKAPVGYLNVRETTADGYEIRTIAVDPDRAEHVTWAFEAYASGAYSVRQLTEALSERGLRTKRVGTRGGKPISNGHIAKMLSNPYYVGTVTFRGVEYQGTHQPIVGPEIFARVQAVLESRRHQGEKQREHAHYLKSTILCGRCGSRLCFTRSRGQGGGLYDYFFCLGRHQRRTGCELPYLSAANIEAAIEDHYATVTLPESRLGQIRDAVRRGMRQLNHQNLAEATRQEKRLVRLRAEREKVLQAHLADAIPIDLLKAEQDRITREMAEAEIVLAASEQHIETIEANLDLALAMIRDCQTAYRAAGQATRRQFNQLFFEYIEVDVDGATGSKLAEPFEALLAEDLLDRLGHELKNPRLIAEVGGSKETLMVGDRGLEPLTSAV